MSYNKRTAVLLAAGTLICGVLAGIAAAGNSHGSPPGQSKSAGSATQTTTTADNSTGVKPGSTTQHNTSAPAGSNKTKQYGNGKTAGKIATQNGASADTTLKGPGNSQPHKVAVCVKGKTHYVDVHALKGKRAGACVAGTGAAAAATSSPAQASTAAPAQSGTTAAPAAGTSHTAAAGGVLGAQATVTHSAKSKPARPAAGGVLGAHTNIAQAKPAHAILGSAHFTG